MSDSKLYDRNTIILQPSRALNLAYISGEIPALTSLGAAEATMVSLQPLVNGIEEPRQEQEHILIADLVRRLVRVVVADQHAIQTQQERDEIILDIDVDGARYVLLRTPSAPPILDSLSPREQQIVRMVAKGCSNKAIAAALHISSWTVCTHLRRTFAKLGVTSRAAMVARLLEEHNGWRQPPNSRGMPTPQHAKARQP